ncbi:lipid phosphate phosphatase epsilon 2, chloroplastic-like [Telopea speciosissima]|uniref:lipid phosphate phosphatase epsilon 2, chloroplastic-like n=1 Tax=Telopea speciosissima TaxID=54955 RepID=UPI001CC493BD|nr:lipid phosphate phosphatase epsilon 2, chloroplastic-like [Telopea speciosissima]
MTSASALPTSYRPVISFSPTLPSCSTRTPKTFLSPSIPTLAPPSIGGCSSRSPISQRNLVIWQKSKIEFVRTASHSDGVEGDELIKRETVLSNVSLEFTPDFVSRGLEATVNRLSKWLVTAILGAFILYRHDAEALWAAIGIIVNFSLSVTLKQILNQKRPISNLKSDPGMPSSHAQSIFFAIIFLIQSLVEWLGVNELTVIVGTLVLACGSYLSWLRVAQQNHTINQVLVGAILGSICSILWFWSWDAIVVEAFSSSLWVRVIFVLGGAGCLAFFLCVVRYWLEEQ